MNILDKLKDLQVDIQASTIMMCEIDEALAKIIADFDPHGACTWSSGPLEGQRIISRGVDGSCWAKITEREKEALENYGAVLGVFDKVVVDNLKTLPPAAPTPPRQDSFGPMLDGYLLLDGNVQIPIKARWHVEEVNGSIKCCKMVGTADRPVKIGNYEACFKGYSIEMHVKRHGLRKSELESIGLPVPQLAIEQMLAPLPGQATHNIDFTNNQPQCHTTLTFDKPTIVERGDA